MEFSREAGKEYWRILLKEKLTYFEQRVSDPN
jgi:hypothetical protein